MLKKKYKFFSFLTALCICFTPLSIGACFGSGAAVIANEVNLTKSAIAGEKICFKDTDFKSALGVTDLKEIVIDSVPEDSDGILLYAGKKASVGQKIKRRNIPSLVFLPASDSVTEVRFSFKAPEFGNKSYECIMRFTPTVNKAPNLDGASVSTVWTQGKNAISGEVKANDPEGDLIQYIVVRAPKHGAIEMNTDGSFVYTPLSGTPRKDSFSYIARDEWGGWSEIGTVQIRL